MSLSLPGNDLYCLSRDNLPPEEYERIISAYAAWSRICREYEFDDRNNNGRYIINMRENRAASHLRPSRGAREKDKLEKMVFSGDIVMLSDIHGPARLFYIDDDGKLICTDSLGFRFDGAKKIIAEYNNSVSRTDYQRSGGKPRPTQIQRLVRASEPDLPAQQAFRTINTKAAGRLLAAGGVYNGNIEGYTKTAQDLGDDASKGFEQVLNKQTVGAAIAASSVLLGMKSARSVNILDETEKLQKSFKGAERAAKFAKNWPEGELSTAVHKFAGTSPTVTTTDKGKRIYTNPETGVQVVEDISGKYFRIYDPSIMGKRAYLDLEGNIPNNKALENGKLTGRNQSEYNEITHFKIKGE
ncbi:TPA: hypothetical protein P4O12_001215 [Yersinia enterocolitica]|nr:hypothetical protein [Yersinia enterocolitica]HDO7713811.1 hypothetical protein [Yersinia enterocolitica]